jgi:hypothetical protein
MVVAMAAGMVTAMATAAVAAMETASWSGRHHHHQPMYMNVSLSSGVMFHVGSIQRHLAKVGKFLVMKFHR